MSASDLFEISINEEIGLTATPTNDDGSAGEVEAGTTAVTFTGPGYTKPNDGSDGREIVEGVIAWFGSDDPAGSGDVTASADADLGSGVKTISDTTPWKSIAAGATKLTLGKLITRPKVAPTP